MSYIDKISQGSNIFNLNQEPIVIDDKIYNSTRHTMNKDFFQSYYTQAQNNNGEWHTEYNKKFLQYDDKYRDTIIEPYQGFYIQTWNLNTNYLEEPYFISGNNNTLLSALEDTKTIINANQESHEKIIQYKKGYLEQDSQFWYTLFPLPYYPTRHFGGAMISFSGCTNPSSPTKTLPSYTNEFLYNTNLPFSDYNITGILINVLEDVFFILDSNNNVVEYVNINMCPLIINDNFINYSNQVVNPNNTIVFKDLFNNATQNITHTTPCNIDIKWQHAILTGFTYDSSYKYRRYLYVNPFICLKIPIYQGGSLIDFINNFPGTYKQAQTYNISSTKEIRNFEGGIDFLSYDKKYRMKEYSKEYIFKYDINQQKFIKNNSSDFIYFTQDEIDSIFNPS